MNNYKHLPFLSAAIVAVLMISNIAATKLVDIGPFTFDGGTLLFPLAYIFGDVLTEVYGYKASRRVIWSAFFWLAVAAITFQGVVWLTPSTQYELQAEFAAILSQTPRIVAGSLLAYWMGEFVNSYVLAKMKVWKQGRALWARAIGSTVFGQGVDTAVFLIVAFWGIFPADLMVIIFVSNYVFKLGVEVLLLPVTYKVIAWWKAAEGIDVYDTNTNYNPFRMD